MGPSIGRSIGQGFQAANRSWAGLAFVAGCWIVVVIFIVLIGALSRIPAELLRERAAPAPTPAVAPSTATAPSATPDAPSSASQPSTDLFSDMATTTDEAPAAQDVQAEDAQAREREDAAERERLGAEWLRRAWPLLVLVVLVIIAGSTWLYGGEIGYLTKQVTAGRAGVSEFWLAGPRVFLALLGSSAISLSAVGAALAVMALIGWAFSRLSTTVPAWLPRILGLILGVAVGIGFLWLVVRLVFWGIAIVADRLGPIAGLKASLRAARGRWWRISGLLALLIVIAYGVSIIFALLEGLGSLIGGAGGAVVGILSSLLSAVASLYVGFAMTAALIRFYEDAKPSASSATVPEPISVS